jgi:hypothetical protein
MELVGVGISAVLLPPSPIVGSVGIRPVDLGLPVGIEAVGINAVLPVPVRPRRESTPEVSPPSKSPEVGVGVTKTELVAEAGTLTGIVGRLEVSNAVALVLLAVEELSPPRPKRSRRSDPELVELTLALLESGLFTPDPVGVAEPEVVVVVEPPRRLPTPEPMSPKMLSLEAAVVEAGVVDALAEESTVDALEAVLEVLEFTPRRSPTSEPRSLKTLPLEDWVADEAGVVEAWTDESTVGVAVEVAEATAAVEVVESPPSRPATPEPMSPSRLPLELELAVEAAVVAARTDESTAGVTVEAVEAAAGVDVVESPPRRLATPEPTSPSKLSLEVEAAVDEAFVDESTAAACLLVVSALAEAASELFWVLSVLAASVCLVVEVVVAVGSPPIVVVPVIR